MTPDRWQRIEQLYHSAREREGSQRVAFLEEECEGDEGTAPRSGNRCWRRRRAQKASWNRRLWRSRRRRCRKIKLGPCWDSKSALIRSSRCLVRVAWVG